MRLIAPPGEFHSAECKSSESNNGMKFKENQDVHTLNVHYLNTNSRRSQVKLWYFLIKRWSYIVERYVLNYALSKPKQSRPSLQDLCPNKPQQPQYSDWRFRWLKPVTNFLGPAWFLMLKDAESYDLIKNKCWSILCRSCFKPHLTLGGIVADLFKKLTY